MQGNKPDKMDYIDAMMSFVNALKYLIGCVISSSVMYGLIRNNFISPDVERDLPAKIIMGIGVVIMAFVALITFFYMLLYLVTGIFALKKDEQSQQKAGKLIWFISMIPALLSEIISIFVGLIFAAFPIVGVLIGRRQGAQIDSTVYVVAALFGAFGVWFVVDRTRRIIRILRENKEVMKQQ